MSDVLELKARLSVARREEFRASMVILLESAWGVIDPPELLEEEAHWSREVERLKLQIRGDEWR